MTKERLEKRCQRFYKSNSDDDGKETNENGFSHKLRDQSITRRTDCFPNPHFFDTTKRSRCGQIYKIDASNYQDETSNGGKNIDIQYIDSETLTATVPAGYRDDIYNLHITNGNAVLYNAFTVYFHSLHDLDGDYDVDGDDRNILRSSLGKCKGDSMYNSDADYDKDSCITYNDYRIWYGHYKTLIAP